MGRRTGGADNSISSLAGSGGALSTPAMAPAIALTAPALAVRWRAVLATFALDRERTQNQRRKVRSASRPLECPPPPLVVRWNAPPPPLTEPTWLSPRLQSAEDRTRTWCDVCRAVSSAGSAPPAAWDGDARARPRRATARHPPAAPAAATLRACPLLLLGDHRSRTNTGRPCHSQQQHCAWAHRGGLGLGSRAWTARRRSRLGRRRHACCRYASFQAEPCLTRPSLAPVPLTPSPPPLSPPTLTTTNPHRHFRHRHRPALQVARLGRAWPPCPSRLS